MKLAEYGAVGAMAVFAIAALCWVIHALIGLIRALVARITTGPPNDDPPVSDIGDDNPPTDDTGEE